MAVRLFAVRHLATKENIDRVFMGQRDCGVLNLEETIDTKKLMAGECFIYTSPLLRARQTAESIMKQRKDIRWRYDVLDSLKERGLGTFEGRKKDELNTSLRFFVNKQLRLDVTPPGAEPFEEFYQRVVGACNEIISDNGNILIVSHLQVIRAIICHLNLLDFSEWYSIQIPYGKVVGIYEK